MSLPYYLRYPEAFADSTFGWPLELKGAYSILLDMIYARDGKLMDDPHGIAGALGCSVRKWNLLKAKLIEKGKIRIDNGIIRNTRADNELISRRSYQDKQAKNRSTPNKNKDEESPPKTYARALSEIRGDSNESPSEADASGAEAPPRDDLFEDVAPQELPKAKPGDDWTIAAELLNPTDPGWQAVQRSPEWTSARDKGIRKFRKVEDVVRERLGGDKVAIAEILSKVVRIASAHAAPDVGYMIETARGLVAELRKPNAAGQSAQDAPPEELQFDGEGRAWFVNSKTGVRRPVAGGKVAA